MREAGRPRRRPASQAAGVPQLADSLLAGREGSALGQLRTSTAVQQKSPFALTSPLVDAVALVGSYLAAGNVFGPSRPALAAEA